jgi:hypothetical protein
MHFIATSGTTGAGGTQFYDFLNIPQTFSHLKLYVTARDTSAFVDRAVFLELNSTGGSAYTHNFLRGNGSSMSNTFSGPNGRFDYDPIPAANAAANLFGAAVIEILDYSSTVKNKTLKINHGTDFNGSGSINLWSGLFASTGAVTNMRLYPNVAFAQYSRIDLYGITSNPVATGA